MVKLTKKEFWDILSKTKTFSCYDMSRSTTEVQCPQCPYNRDKKPHPLGHCTITNYQNGLKDAYKEYMEEQLNKLW